MSCIGESVNDEVVKSAGGTKEDLVVTVLLQTEKLGTTFIGGSGCEDVVNLLVESHLWRRVVGRIEVDCVFLAVS